MDSFIPRESIYNLLEKEACVEKKSFLRIGQYKQNVVGSSTFGMKNNIYSKVTIDNNNLTLSLFTLFTYM